MSRAFAERQRRRHLAVLRPTGSSVATWVTPEVTTGALAASPDWMFPGRTVT